jgi:hypothetical protein
MVLMDSTCLKFSSDILFVIFGCRNQKLLIFKDLDEIWFENLIWICFGSEVATCRNEIHRYRFVRITNVER